MTWRLRALPEQPDSVTVTECELAAVTADGADCPQLDPLVPVLHQLRHVLGIELIFVGAVRDGAITSHPAGRAGADDSFAETAYGRMLLEVRCGATPYAAVPVMDDGGSEAGTLLCNVAAQDGHPPKSLRTASRLIASRIQALGPGCAG